MFFKTVSVLYAAALLLPIATQAQYYEDDALELYARGFADGLAGLDTRDYEDVFEARDVDEELFAREPGCCGSKPISHPMPHPNPTPQPRPMRRPRDVEEELFAREAGGHVSKPVPNPNPPSGPSHGGGMPMPIPMRHRRH